MQTMWSLSQRKVWFACAFAAFLTILVVFNHNNDEKKQIIGSTTSSIIYTRNNDIINNSNNNNINNKNKINNNDDDIPYYTCPISVTEAENYDEEDFTSIYTDVTREIQKNMTNFLEEFRDRPFDGHHHTYNEYKQQMMDWKTRRIVPYLRDGDAIYESACGIGLNLLMTVETAFEKKGIQNLTVYGNEYLAISAQTANEIFDELPRASSLSSSSSFRHHHHHHHHHHGDDAGVRKGVICQGDSSNLQFVPSNSFDLVYTGYISTLLDPLQFNFNSSEEAKAMYESLCDFNHKKKNDPDYTILSQKLNEISQQRQNDWFAKWVTEMIRIAKPGRPIVIEDVSRPFCHRKKGSGGVDESFWTSPHSVEQYHWDIDPSSIEIEISPVDKHRYNVFMKKNSVV